MAAAIVVIVAGLRAAQAIVVPFVVAVFLAMICLPFLNWLRQKGLPSWAALVVISVVIVVAGLVVMGVIGSSVNSLRNQLPEYEKSVARLQENVLKWLDEHGIEGEEGFRRENFDAKRAVSLFGNLLAALASMLSNALVIIFILIFMLLEAADLPGKLRAISRGTNVMEGRWEVIQGSVRQYVTIKTRLSALTGALVAIWLWILGVDFALLWGLLAFLFNYIPNVGSLIAAVPAIVLAQLQPVGGGFALALYTTVGYLAINGVIGNILEPRLMGRGLGLSALVVFLSLLFWGWVLGPIGMLFSVPLTMIVKIVLDNSDDLQWVAILLSGDVPQAPAVPQD